MKIVSNALSEKKLFAKIFPSFQIFPSFIRKEMFKNMYYVSYKL